MAEPFPFEASLAAALNAERGEGTNISEQGCALRRDTSYTVLLVRVGVPPTEVD